MDRNDLAAVAAHTAAAERLLYIKRARTSLAAFIHYMMPDPEHPDDPSRSQFQQEPHHKLLIEMFEDFAHARQMRQAVSMPPQHGKSTIISIYGPAWMMGLYPHLRTIIGGYGSEFITTVGGQVKNILQSKRYHDVFPGTKLRKDSQAKDEMFTTMGGSLTFVGRRESTTGKPADRFIIDDPLKDRVEANSEIVRRELHQWYASVVFTRCHSRTPIFILHTRWHEDDLIGRQCDPDHPDHNPKRAARWRYINIPAIIDDPMLAEALDKQVGDALWPSRFSLEHLEEARENDEREFASLYMGRPTPDDGDFFKREWLVEYKPDDLPAVLNKFAASDHAVTAKQERDANVFGAFGVDSRNHIWILPDLVWERMEADETVEEMIALMKRHRPFAWFAEDELINKTLGPFRRARMQEERVYTTVHGIRPIKDLRARARSIQGRMQMGMVHFPAFAPWWSDAKNELLKFPNATHDDFVAFLALVGLGLDMEFAAAPPAEDNGNVVKVGSIKWIKARSEADKRRKAARQAAAGF